MISKIITGKSYSSAALLTLEGFAGGGKTTILAQVREDSESLELRRPTDRQTAVQGPAHRATRRSNRA